MKLNLDQQNVSQFTPLQKIEGIDSSIATAGFINRGLAMGQKFSEGSTLVHDVEYKVQLKRKWGYPPPNGKFPKGILSTIMILDQDYVPFECEWLRLGNIDHSADPLIQTYGAFGGDDIRPADAPKELLQSALFKFKNDAPDTRIPTYFIMYLPYGGVQLFNVSLRAVSTETDPTLTGFLTGYQIKKLT